MPLILPTQPSPATERNSKALLLYGVPKVGKTAMLTALPNLLLVDCEKGSSFVSCMKINIESLDEMTELSKSLTEARHPYSYVAIDTIDKVEEWCEHHATLLYKVSPVGVNFTGRSVLELPNGAGYLWLRKSFNKFFDLAKTFAPYVIFIGHIRDKQLATAGKEVTSKDLDLTGKIKSIVCSYVDSIGHVYRKLDGKLAMTFETKESVMCGSRCTHLKGREFLFTYPEATAKDWEQIYLPTTI